MAVIAHQVPDFIMTVIDNLLPRNTTFNPLTPFYFYKTGQFPPWVVNWFVKIQKPTRVVNQTLFFRALHYIEFVRGLLHGVEEVVHGEEEEAIQGILADSLSLGHFLEPDEDQEPPSKKWKGKGTGKKSKKASSGEDQDKEKDEDKEKQTDTV